MLKATKQEDTFSGAKPKLKNICKVEKMQILHDNKLYLVKGDIEKAGPKNIKVFQFKICQDRKRIHSFCDSVNGEI